MTLDFVISYLDDFVSDGNCQDRPYLIVLYFTTRRRTRPTHSLGQRYWLLGVTLYGLNDFYQLLEPVMNFKTGSVLC